ncbi:MAG: SRPBCC domain-containing protein [Chloroflexi bacterium]|nr:SRPBCC domain-containing protein [Chloroflexota bacterium]
MASKMSVEVRDRTIEVVQPFEATPEQLFLAFSDSDALKQWFGPEGWPLTVSDIDFRVGGSWHYCMSGPDGMEAWGIALYDEIMAPTLIRYRDAFSDADRTVVPRPPTSRSPSRRATTGLRCSAGLPYSSRTMRAMK